MKTFADAHREKVQEHLAVARAQKQLDRRARHDPKFLEQLLLGALKREASMAAAVGRRRGHVQPVCRVRDAAWPRTASATPSSALRGRRAGRKIDFRTGVARHTALRARADCRATARGGGRQRAAVEKQARPAPAAESDSDSEDDDEDEAGAVVASHPAARRRAAGAQAAPGRRGAGGRRAPGRGRGRRGRGPRRVRVVVERPTRRLLRTTRTTTTARPTCPQTCSRRPRPRRRWTSRRGSVIVVRPYSQKREVAPRSTRAPRRADRRLRIKLLHTTAQPVEDLVGVQNVGLFHPTKLEEHPQAQRRRAPAMRTSVGNSAAMTSSSIAGLGPLSCAKPNFAHASDSDAFSSSRPGIRRNDANHPRKQQSCDQRVEDREDHAARRLGLDLAKSE